MPLFYYFLPNGAGKINFTAKIKCTLALFLFLSILLPVAHLSHLPRLFSQDATPPLLMKEK
jgi:hypothetical protein